MNQEMNDYRDILREHFLVRKEVNPSYSLRSYARDLEMPSSNLSSVLNGKQGLSFNTANNISNKLRINGDEREKFLNLVLATDGRSKKVKLQAQKYLDENCIESDKKQVQDDFFKLISDWYYFAILELMTLDYFVSDHEWIANKLQLEVTTVDKALERLLRLKLIDRKDGAYLSTGVQLDTSYDIPSVFIKKINAQLINKAAQSINEQSVEQRELSTLTVAIDKDDIGFVKEEIRKFKNELDKKLMSRAEKKKRDGVYCLSIQFFDLLKGKDK